MKFKTEKMKVIFALSYMKEGTAEHWRNVHIQNMMDNKWGCTDSWVNFIKQLRKDFGDANLASNWLHKVEILKQGTRSADEYTVKFNMLIEETDIKEDARWLWLYQWVINEPLVYKSMALIPSPTPCKSGKKRLSCLITNFARLNNSLHGGVERLWHPPP